MKAKKKLKQRQFTHFSRKARGRDWLHARDWQTCGNVPTFEAGNGLLQPLMRFNKSVSRTSSIVYLGSGL